MNRHRRLHSGGVNQDARRENPDHGLNGIERRIYAGGNRRAERSVFCPSVETRMPFLEAVANLALWGPRDSQAGARRCGIYKIGHLQTSDLDGAGVSWAVAV